LYCGIWYVESRVPGGIDAQPPFVFVPAALMYDGPVAHAMYFQASLGSGELFGIASAQLHSQPDDFVLYTGAKAKPFSRSRKLPDRSARSCHTNHRRRALELALAPFDGAC